MPSTTHKETRRQRSRRRNREALIQSAFEVIATKGIEATTVQDITEHADLGVGTAYNYFQSKEEIIQAAIERGLERLALLIDTEAKSIEDPGEVFAFGALTVMETLTTEPHWRWLVRRSDVTADAILRCLGPFAMRDLSSARAAGRYQFENLELVWRQATWTIVGVSLAVCNDELNANHFPEAVVNMLAMVGLSRDSAWKIIHRLRPLPKSGTPTSHQG